MAAKKTTEQPSMAEVFKKEEDKEEKVTLNSGFEVKKKTLEELKRNYIASLKEVKESTMPVGYIANKPAYTMADYVEIEKTDAEAELQGSPISNRVRLSEFDSYGNLKRVPRDKYVVMENIEFLNRVRVNEDKTVSVVIDWRAINDHRSGRIYTTTLPAYRIGLKDGELQVLKAENISDTEFIANFKDEFIGDNARVIKEIASHYQNTGTNTGLDLKSIFG